MRFVNDPDDPRVRAEGGQIMAAVNQARRDSGQEPYKTPEGADADPSPVEQLVARMEAFLDAQEALK